MGRYRPESGIAGVRLSAKLIHLRAIALLLFCAGSVCAGVPRIIKTIRADTLQSLLGWHIVPVGDQNDDGYDDILIWEARGGLPSIALYLGGNPPADTAVMRIHDINTPVSNVGDINFDGYDDFAMLGRSSFGWKHNLYFGGPTFDTVRDLWFGLDTLGTGIFTARGNDIDADGNDDIITGSFQQATALLFELGTDSDSVPDIVFRPIAFPYNGTFSRSLVSGDFNGDGFTDLAISAIPSSIFQVSGQVHLYFGGVGFDTLPDLVLKHPDGDNVDYTNFGSITKNLGDVNGDGFDDLFVGPGNSGDSIEFIYFGGPSIDSIPDVVIPDNTIVGNPAGDVNADGYNDLITAWNIEAVGGGYVNIYYGGPQMDSIPDKTIRGFELPEPVLLFGKEATGVGDIDGDGVGDFAVSAVDVFFIWKVYIFSGEGIITDVDDDNGSGLPTDFQLDQNYPNPFNPSTTIEFDLPRRGHVTLTIYNILGQEVLTILDREMSSGHHTATWDGRDSRLNEVSSGVYLYRLRAGEFGQVRKMILLK